MQMTITCYSQNGTNRQQANAIDSFVSPLSYQPIVTLSQPIHIPANLAEGIPNDNEYLIKVAIEIESWKKQWLFDVECVYNAEME